MNLELVNNDEVKKKKYSRKELIEKLQQWVKENGRIPKVEDFKNNPDPDYPGYI